MELLKDPNCSTASWPTSSAAAWWASRSTSWSAIWRRSPQARRAAGRHRPVEPAAGKSLMEAILAFVPPEQRIKYTAMTGQSLYYLGEQDLKHKVLAIVEEEGASGPATP